VLLVDIDVGNGGLAIDILQRSLEIRAIINLIKFNSVVVCAKVAQESLGGLAIRAVRFAEDGDSILINDVLGFGLGGRHIDGADGRREESA